MDEWNPTLELSPQEERVLRLCRKQKLWGFFRHYRHVILDEEIRAELRAMFPSSGPGRPPVAPEQLALAMLLQVGFGVADHEVPTLTAVDARWQVVLDCLGAAETAFSQGTVFNFRERARKHGLMRRLLDKTVQIARETGGFSHKRLRVLIDSSPLVGAGRVEDTFNLLGRAISELVAVAATEADRDAAELATELKVDVALGSSVKAVLDVDWREPRARAAALGELLAQFERLQVWLRSQFDVDQLSEPPLADSIATVEQIIEQDTEPEPEPDGEAPRDVQTAQIRKGVAKDRLVSLSDRDMRHGRKSKSKAFSGYKRHVGADADIPGIIVDVEAMRANRPEKEAAEPIIRRLEPAFDIIQAQFDRGYIGADIVVELRERGVEVITKPPTFRNSGRFTKSEFVADFATGTLTCPAEVTVPIPSNRTVLFPRSRCHACAVRERCITEDNKRGRQVQLHADEEWYREMSAELATPEGRAKRRERTVVEHVLARVSTIQGNKARYRGLGKNQAHLEIVGVVNNCYVLGELFAAREAA